MTQNNIFSSQPSLFQQKLLHKALHFKFQHMGASLDAVLSDPDNQEAIKGKYKNVCTLIDEALLSRLEGALDVLNMSKREFLEMAIIEALHSVDSIINEVDAFEFERALSEQYSKEGA
jgi:hypothetical protein